VNTDVNGAGPYSPGTGSAFGIAPIPVVNGAATAVYEVLESDPNSFATVDVPIYVAYTSNAPSNMPGIGAATVSLSYGPLSTVTSAVAANVPRFTDLLPASNAFTIEAPTCATFVSDTASINVSGGTGSIAVTADPSCHWAPFTTDDWITFSPTGSVSGSGTLNYSVTPNTVPFERSGVISLAFGQPPGPNQALTITQAAFVCTYSAGPTTAVSGGFIMVATNSESCPWTAVSNDAWITLTSPNSNFGSASVGYSLTANPGALRTGTLTVAGQTITITQPAPGQGVPTPLSVSPSSGSGATLFIIGFSDVDGWQDLKILNVLINSALDGRNACYVAVIPSGQFSGTVLLVNDAGSAGGPFQTLLIPSSGVISNSQCTISGTDSSIQNDGSGSVTVTLAVTFSPGFAGNKVVYRRRKISRNIARAGKREASGTFPAQLSAVRQ
jgi:hypothetical protein